MKNILLIMFLFPMVCFSQSRNGLTWHEIMEQRRFNQSMDLQQQQAAEQQLSRDKERFDELHEKFVFSMDKATFMYRQKDYYSSLEQSSKARFYLSQIENYIPAGADLSEAIELIDNLKLICYSALQDKEMVREYLDKLTPYSIKSQKVCLTVGLVCLDNNMQSEANIYFNKVLEMDPASSYADRAIKMLAQK